MALNRIKPRFSNWTYFYIPLDSNLNDLCDCKFFLEAPVPFPPHWFSYIKIGILCWPVLQVLGFIQNKPSCCKYHRHAETSFHLLSLTEDYTTGNKYIFYCFGFHIFNNFPLTSLLMQLHTISCPEPNFLHIFFHTMLSLHILL